MSWHSNRAWQISGGQATADVVIISGTETSEAVVSDIWLSWNNTSLARAIFEDVEGNTLFVITPGSRGFTHLSFHDPITLPNGLVLASLGSNSVSGWAQYSTDPTVSGTNLIGPEVPV